MNIKMMNREVTAIFKHETYQEHFEIHRLSDDQGNVLELVPARGGIVSNFKAEGLAVFYMDYQSLYDPTLNVRGGNPVLFPICGPLRDSRYKIDGKWYEMKQHGFARNRIWLVEGVELTEERGAILLSLESNEGTMQQYPRHFRLEFKYVLEYGKLTIEQRYINRSAQPMPFYAGFHPYFASVDKRNVKIELQADEYENFLTKESSIPPLGFDFDSTEETNGAYHRVAGEKVRIYGLGHDRTIQIRMQPPYKHIVVWALQEKPFVCVEPWMGINYGMNLDDSVVVLEAGAELQTEVSYSVF